MTKKFLSVLLAMVLVLNVFIVSVSAADNQSEQAEIKYKIDYHAAENWGNTQTAEIKITNTGKSDLEGWAVQFNAEGTIKGLWGASLYMHEGTEYILESAQYNAVIKPNQSVTIGYQYTSDKKDKPENLVLCSERAVMDGGYTAELKKVGGWGNEATCQLTIKNTGDTPIKLWELSFDKTFEILDVWNAKVINRTETSYTIKAEDGNQYIQPNSSITIGMTCKNVNEVKIQNSILSQIVINNTPLALFGMGSFNSETNAIELSWYSTIPTGLFTVQLSTDGINYSNIASKNDILEYSYMLTDTSYDTYNFRIKETTNGGKTVESNIITLKKCDSGYEMQDTDGDGIPDSYEDLIGTDKHNPDTDGDGLIDYEELVLTGTDPLKYDTDGNGICDADEDLDKDGLTNSQEIQLGTDPQNDDSDSDGIKDGEEVNTHHTDPIKDDTDEDGIKDGDEIKVGLDPTNPSTNGVPDKEYTIEQTIDSEFLKDINTDNSYQLSIDITAAGNAQNSISVQESGYTNSLSGNSAIVGKIIEVTYDDLKVDHAILKFKFSDDIVNETQNLTNISELQGLQRFQVFRYEEDNDILYPVQTEFNEDNNTISAKSLELGTYCIIDLDIWMNDLGLLENAAEPIAANNKIQPVDLEVKQPIQQASSNAPVNNPQEGIKKYTFKDHQYAVIDMAMSWDEAKYYCEDQLGCHLVTITDSSEQNFISSLARSGSKNVYWIGLANFKNTWQWVTKEPFGYSNWSYGEPNDSSENFVHIYNKIPGGLIQSGEWNDTYSRYTDKGSFFDTSNSGFICEWDNEPLTEYNMIFANSVAKKSLKSPLIQNGTTDSDNDGLTDSQEVNWDIIKAGNGAKIDVDGAVINLPTYKKYLSLFETVKKELEPFGRFIGVDLSSLIYNMQVLPIKSDPTSADRDKDGILDNIEIFPLKFDTTPIEFCKMYHKNLIEKKDIKHTDDGFYMCYKPLSEILLDLNFNKIDDKGFYFYEYYDDWYIFAISDNIDYEYSILKMREFDDEGPDFHDQGVSVPFLSLNMDLFENYESGKLTLDLDNALNIVAKGDRIEYSKTIAKYFANTESDGSYLIADCYIDKIIKTNFKIKNSLIAKFQDKKIGQITIKDKNNLSQNEIESILKLSVGSECKNAFAGEIQVHAILTGVNGTLDEITNSLWAHVTISMINPQMNISLLIINLLNRKVFLEHAVKADVAYGEEWFDSITYNFYVSKDSIYSKIQKMAHGYK